MIKRALMTAAMLVAALSLLPAYAGAAGDCGPGPLIMQKSGGIIQQLLGFSTNGTFFLTYGGAITTGTSGCSNSGVVEADRETVQFVAWNAEPLSRDAARGHGPYLETMAVLLGCAPDATADFAAATQSAFPALEASPADDAPGWLAQLRTQVGSDTRLTTRCTRLS